jgi:hypothetical protein
MARSMEGMLALLIVLHGNAVFVLELGLAGIV